MRRPGNLLLILLLVNGAIALLRQTAPGIPLVLMDSLGALVAVGIVLLSLALLPFLAANRNLPSGAFLPQLFLFFWSGCGLWPLTGWFGQEFTFTVFALLQCLVALLSLFSIRRRNGSSLLLTREQFASPGFSLGHLLRYTLAGLLVVPACLLLYGVSLFGSYLQEESGGFVRLGVDGLYMTERTYQRDGQTVRLTGMIHIGDQAYYTQLLESLAGADTLVLAEGVSDVDGLLRQRFSYNGLANLLGLASQEQVSFEGRLIAPEQLRSADFVGAGEQAPDILRADIDLREFDPRTVEFVNAIGRFLTENELSAESLLDFNRWAQERLTPELRRIIMADLVDKRNRLVIDYLDAALPKYGHVVIPWGALHMVGIEKAVLARGFVLSGERERRSIAFRTLPYARLLGSLAGRQGEE